MCIRDRRTIAVHRDLHRHDRAKQPPMRCQSAPERAPRNTGRYLLRVTINRQAVSGKIVHEEGFLVQVATESPETNNAIKMEVGIEDCLHIEFEYNKSKYHLQDVVLGKIFFLLVRLAARTPYPPRGPSRGPRC